ncbi:MAG: phage tail tape measure protein, partial [Planctomycetota bacterium]
MRAFSAAVRTISGFFTGSAKAANEFNEAFTKSTAIMGELSETMRTDMKRATDEVAKTTTFSAKEAAEAYFFLASAGMDAAQSIKALPQVSKFAQAGTFDLAMATDLLTDAQSALGMTIRDDVVKNMENMGRVSDVLVKANTIANASVAQFSEALTTKAGASLRQWHKDVEEGVAVLAVFADQGRKGAEAGTGLSIVLRDLSTKAIKNADAFKKYGVAVFDANEKMRNIADIIADLEGVLGEMSDAQAKATLLQLGFSDKSVVFIQSLIGMSDQIRNYEEQLREAAGTTDEVASKQLTSMAAQLKLTGDSWQLLLRDIGDFISESEGVKELLAGIRDLFEYLRDSLEENREAWIKFVSGGLNFFLEAAELVLKAIELITKDLVGQSLVFIKITKLWAKFKAPSLLPKLEEAEDMVHGLAEIGMGAGKLAEAIDDVQKKITDATGAQLAFTSGAKGFEEMEKEVRKFGKGAEAVFQSLLDSGVGATAAFEMVTEAADRASKLEGLTAGQLSVFKALEEAGFSSAEAFQMVSKSVGEMGNDLDDAGGKVDKLTKDFGELLTAMGPGFVQVSGNTFTSIENALLGIKPAVQDVRDEFEGWLETSSPLMDGLGRTLIDFVPKMQDVRDESVLLKEESVDLSRSIEELAAAFQLLGLDVTTAIGAITIGVAQLARSIPAIKDFKKSIVGDPDLSGAQKLSAGISAGAQGVAGIIQATGSGSRAKRVAGGAMQGAAAGGQIGGPIGAAIGAGVGAIVGALRGRKHMKVMSEIGRDWGVKISEELAKQIVETAKRLDLGRFEARLLHLSDVIAEVGVGGTEGIAKWSAEVLNLMNAVELGSVP